MSSPSTEFRISQHHRHGSTIKRAWARNRCPEADLISVRATPNDELAAGKSAVLMAVFRDPDRADEGRRRHRADGHDEGAHERKDRGGMENSLDVLSKEARRTHPDSRVIGHRRRTKRFV